MVCNYCKHCGNKLDDNPSHCAACNTAVGEGNHFCGNCGTAVAEEQALCLHCGFFLREMQTQQSPEETPAHTLSRNTPEYQKYAGKFKKATILALIAQICSLLAIISLVFAPIYISKKPLSELDLSDDNLVSFAQKMEELNRWNNMEELLKDPEFLEKGTVNVGFSLFNDIKVIADSIFGKDADSSAFLLNFLVGIMALFEIVFAIVASIVIGKKIYQLVSRLTNPESDLMLTFNEIRKTGSGDKKINLLKQQSIIVVIIYLVFDIMYSKVFGFLSSILLGEGTLKDIPLRNMMTFSAFSKYIILPLLFVIGYIISQSLQKKKEKQMLVEITQAQYTKE